MTTMIYDLPRDLIEEIFSRLPLKSMKAVRLTCKSWNNLFKSKVTTPTREGETMMIFRMMPDSFCLMSGIVDVDPSIERKGQLSFLYKVSVSRIYHYEGLILCKLKDVNRVMVWNPYLGQTRWINLRYSHLINGFNRYSYALGYEDKESCRSVKLLRFLDYFFHAPETQFFWYEIYDFDSGLWKTLDVTPNWGIYCSSPSVSLKGNTYWCASKRSSEGCMDHIICFDFTKERFGPLLPLPSSVRDRKSIYATLSCVKEEKLAALFQRPESYELYFEIWITTKIEAEMVSWSKFLRMDTGPKVNVPGSFLIDEEKKVFMGFCTDYNSDYDDCPKKFINIIGEAGYLKKLDLGVPAYQNHWLDVCSYVPSLVQIKKLARGKRIKQRSLEKHRFDQNRSRTLRGVEFWKRFEVLLEPYGNACIVMPILRT
ncbi:putative F-box protein At5g41510 isoform X1 [Arabidopsis lyrata subsp. lyrata]|uniref:putative F-box protein At5g41510 isoform X1 n=1 Tax=Arabidopsis lyrata subsp. lyrata TaxID=81972 RepID=UPI000A29A391|nr:putative F-box protein At5g41510 isoform X1 [Arabidopsis lyrata subsp. lyrata]|eukprot:XP_020882845.1 putative F-box protein At5g41510 isoform X1 [Arabidopsis lyrata subsp. lyrata]